MTHKEPVPAKLQEFIDGLIKIKEEHNLSDDTPLYINVGNKKGSTLGIRLPLITIDIPKDKASLGFGSQAPLDEIVKNFKIFDDPVGKS